MTTTKNREPIAERFARDIANHVMEIRHDDGLYRHVVFKQPNDSCLWYSLNTSPGMLIYAGDMGTFVFQRLNDMFEFFRRDRPDRHPNFGYWHSKLVAVDHPDGSQKYCVELFREVLESYDIVGCCDEENCDCESLSLLQKLISDFIDTACGEFEYESPQAAFQLVSDFRLPGDEEFFTDFFDHTLKRYTLRYEWACWAIQHGIAMYDAAKATAG